MSLFLRVVTIMVFFSLILINIVIMVFFLIFFQKRKLQEWTQGVSDEIIENFRREKIQGRHLNYLTEYMIKKGLLSKRTEDETPHRVRPIAARLGPLKTVCRALKMHVGQAKGILEIFFFNLKKNQFLIFLTQSCKRPVRSARRSVWEQ